MAQRLRVILVALVGAVAMGLFTPGTSFAVEIQQASVPGGDFNGDGRDDIAWYQDTDHDSVGEIHMLTSTGSSFGFTADWRTGIADPQWSGSGDFNGDGKDDIAWFNDGDHDSVGEIHMLTSTGSAFNFTANWRSGMGRPGWAGVGDFNADGKDDIAWYHDANHDSIGEVHMLTSTGSGFNFTANWRTGMGRPQWAGTGDFNADGKDDIAWYHDADHNSVGEVHMLSSTGSAFNFTANWRTGMGRTDWAGVGDFNADGKDDIAWFYDANHDSVGEVHMLSSTGSAFNFTANWRTGMGRPGWAGVGDYTADGKDDIAWFYDANHDSVGEIHMLSSTGSAFSFTANWRAGMGRPEWAGPGTLSQPGTRPGGDFNGDGHDDLAWFQQSTGNVSVMTSYGSGFGWQGTWRSGMGSEDWAGVGDFNGDGHDDAAWYQTGTGNVSVMTSYGSGFAWQGTWRSALGNPDWAGVGDFNGDRHDDLVWYHQNTGQVYVMTSNGSSFTWQGSWRAGLGRPSWAGVGDFNGDGHDDIAWYHHGTGEVSVMTSNGGSFTWQGVWRSGMRNADWAGVGDFNGDGHDDIAWYQKATGDVSVITSTGSAFAWQGAWRSSMTAPDWAAVGDYDGDRHDDISWFQESTGDVSVMTSYGSGFAWRGTWRASVGLADWAGPGSHGAWASRAYGGGDERVGTTAEMNDVLDAIGASVDGGASVVAGLTAADLRYVEDNALTIGAVSTTTETLPFVPDDPDEHDAVAAGNTCDAKGWKTTFETLGGADLVWIKQIVKWCWNAVTLQLTSVKRGGVTYDTPGPFWQPDGATVLSNSGGKGDYSATRTARKPFKLCYPVLGCVQFKTITNSMYVNAQGSFLPGPLDSTWD